MLKSRFAFLYLVFASASSGLFAQNTPQYTLHLFDPLQINPAIAGIEQGPSASALYRQQWVGFAGAPTTGVINVHTPVNALKMGFGLSVISDRIGNFKNTMVAPSFAYKLRLGVNVLQFGLAPVIHSVQVSDNWLAVDGRENDPSIPQGNLGSNAIDANSGIFFKGGKYFVGLSVSNLLKHYNRSVNQQSHRTLFVQMGYQYKMAFLPSVDWTAAMLYKSPMGLSGSQWELSNQALIRDALSIGLAYRQGQTVAPLIGYQRFVPSGKIRIAYSYDYNFGTLQKTNGGSHEIAVNYQLLLTKPVENERYKNVRFL